MGANTARSLDDQIADTPLLAPLTSANRRADRERLKERLLPRIVELAKARGAEGFTAADVVSAAIADWGIFTGDEWRGNQRAYAWLGPWLAALARNGTLAPLLAGGFHVRRRSTRERSHSNDGLVYVAGAR